MMMATTNIERQRKEYRKTGKKKGDTKITKEKNTPLFGNWA